MRTSFLYLLTASLICGCGELAYKQGAGVRELDHAKQACRSANEANLEQCLAAHGWYIHQFEDPNTTAELDMHLDRNLAEVDSAEIDTAEINTIDKMHAETPKASHAESAINRDIKPATVQTPAANKAAPEKTQKINPAKVYRISSWWKIGASEKMMKMDIMDCGEKLGEEHRPDMAEQRYTLALIQCMNRQGWKALGASAEAVQ